MTLETKGAIYRLETATFTPSKRSTSMRVAVGLCLMIFSIGLVLAAGSDGTSPSGSLSLTGTLSAAGSVIYDPKPSGITTTAIKVGAGQNAVLGNNVLTNSEFSASDFSGWTAGTNWSVVSNGVKHTPGSTEGLTQNITVTKDTLYQIDFEQPTSFGQKNITPAMATAGAVTFSIGASSVTYVVPYGHSVSLIANQTGQVAFKITPSGNYDGTLSKITLRPITASSALWKTLHADGSADVEIRSGVTQEEHIPGGPNNGITGQDNMFVGLNSGAFNTRGFQNVAYGPRALQDNTTGFGNTAIGYNAMLLNTSGWEDTAVGINALSHNTTGFWNVACGHHALASNTTGIENTGLGYDALWSNKAGNLNTSIGFYSLWHNVLGIGNSAVGASALYENVTGVGNTAIGAESLKRNTASDNTATGANALFSNLTGQKNTAVGYRAGDTETAGNANVTGSNNTWIGVESGPGISNQLENSIGIGYRSHPVASNQAMFGNNSITSTILYGNVGVGTTSPQSKLVVIGTVQFSGLAQSTEFQAGVVCSDTQGQLICEPASLASSKRFLTNDTKPLDGAMSELKKLTTVSFSYSPSFNGVLQENPNYSGQQVGFIAEDVQSVDPRLVTIEVTGKNKGRPHSVRYEDITALLVKGVQELQASSDARIQALEAMINKQQAQIERQQQQIKLLQKK